MKQIICNLDLCQLIMFWFCEEIPNSYGSRYLKGNIDMVLTSCTVGLKTILSKVLHNKWNL